MNEKQTKRLQVSVIEPPLNKTEQDSYNLVMEFWSKITSPNDTENIKIFNNILRSIHYPQVVGKLLYEGTKEDNKLLIASVLVSCPNANQVQLPIFKEEKEFHISALSLLRTEATYYDKKGKIVKETNGWTPEDFEELKALKGQLSENHLQLYSRLARHKYKPTSQTGRA